MEHVEPPVDPVAYAEFIRQIELRQIWLRSAAVETAHGAAILQPSNVTIESEAEWEPVAGGFRAFHVYTVRVESNDAPATATIKATFAIDFASEQTMTEALFPAFADVNLRVNTWPYLREFLFSIMGRMGWVAVTLPTFKVGVRSSPDRQDAVPAGKSRRGRARPKRQQPTATSAETDEPKSDNTEQGPS